MRTPPIRYARRGWLVALMLLVLLPATGFAAPSLDEIRDAISRGQWALASTELDILVADASSVDVETEARLLRARLRQSRGDLEGALADVDVIDRLGAPLAVQNDARFLRGELSYALGRYDDSERAFAAFARGAPGDDRVEASRWYRAEAAAHSGNTDVALQLYDHLARTTSSPEVRQRALRGRAWCHRRMGREEAALTDFAAVAAGADADLAARARFEAGASAYRLGRHPEVLRWLSADAAGDDVRRATMLGQSTFALGRHTEALPYLETALDHAGDADRPALLYQIGWCHLETESNEDAVARFRSLTQLPVVPGDADFERFVTFQVFVEMVDLKLVAFGKRVVIVFVDEGQRQHAEVDQVLSVDTCEATRDNGPQAEIARSKRRVFAARALTVVVAGDDRMTAFMIGGQFLLLFRHLLLRFGLRLNKLCLWRGARFFLRRFFRFRFLAFSRPG